MSFSLTPLLLAGVGYLLLLFAIAHLGERGGIPERVLRHPLIYILSLGVFSSAFAIYGVVGLAYDYGYGFLSYYAGVAGTFVFAPLILLPLLRICRLYQLSSLADLLTFRFRSQWAGSAVTLFMLLAMLPLLALQIQAVSDTVRVLTQGTDQLLAPGRQSDHLALIFCVIITAFTILFGSKYRSAHERHNGLVAAIAFESVFKLGALLLLGAVAVFGVFDGFDGLDRWLGANPDVLQLLSAPMREDSARSLMLIFFSVSICMPHMFHMLFAENPSPGALQTASWGFSIFLLLLSLPVLPILWAGFALDSHLPPEYFALALPLELGSTGLSLLVYIASLSAASGTIIVITLALASMCLNHLILPFYQPPSSRDIYRWLLTTRRLLIVAIILGGYGFYRLITGREDLTGLGMAACIATLQFLPGVLAVMYWPRANRIGLLAGLVAGFLVWFFTLLLPLVSNFQPEQIFTVYFETAPEDIWSATTIISLALNALVFALVSLLTPTSDEERASAEVCSLNDLNRPVRRPLNIRSVQEIKQRLGTVLGDTTAEREVNRALTDLNLSPNDNRPYSLRRLRYRIEINLSGLMGPSVAHDIVNRLFPYEPSGSETIEDINLIEARLERYQYHLTGLAADLDSLRRHHRQTLQDLPIGLCSLGRDREILMWNRAIEDLTGIQGRDVVGSHVSSLPPTWARLLDGFFQAPNPHLHKQRVEIDGRTRWISLHKTNLQPAETGIDPNAEPRPGVHDGQVIMVEDMTETQLLEEELVHSERLASIGRLAAGVAHEIGNPVTGIACLAQNIKYDTENPDSLRTAEEILQQTLRISRIVQTLVNFAHAGADSAGRQPVAMALQPCVDEAIHLLALNKDARPVRFINRCTPTVHVLADNQRLLQVFVNLLSNARDACHDHDPIVVDCEDSRPRVHITLTDQGSGISEQHMEKIFEPFFTTKEPGKGTGLGLALVYGIIEDLNGEIDIESPVPELGCGTRVHLWLPAVGE